MSFTYKELVEANKGIKPIDIKGKDYAQVNDRVKVFRQLCPNGTITTEIINMADGVVTMKAAVYDEEGKILSTGLAQEKESDNFINKTSYIENCETSAVGRALGFVGIGVEQEICSAEECINAAKNQDTPLTEKEIEILKRMCESKGLDIEATFPCGVQTLTSEQYSAAVKKLSSLKDKK